MIVTRKEAERLLGKSLRGPKYVGKRWFLLSRARPHKNLGGFRYKAEAQQHEKDVQYFKHQNPLQLKERVPAPAAGRRIWKAMRDGGKFTAKDASKEAELSEVEAEMGIAWLHEHGYIKSFPGGKKYKILVRNPKPFFDREHDWDEVLIAHEGKKVTRKQILDYYKKNKNKIWPFLKDQTVMVIIGVKRNEFIRRRHAPDGRFIKLTKLEGVEDPSSFEYWIYRRTIEFHPTLMTSQSPILWLDLDMHTTKSVAARKKLLGKMKRAVPKLKKIFNEMGVKKVYVYTSGAGGGLHLEGDLDKKRNVDSLRRKFTKRLAQAFEDDPVFTTGLARSGQIRLDTTTFHKLGSLRAPYSMTVMGAPKKRLGK